MYVGVKDSDPEPGKQLIFYGAYTMEKTGEATVVEAVKNEDKGITKAFWDALKKAECLTWDVVPWLVTLDRDIHISELEVLDCQQARIPTSWIHAYRDRHARYVMQLGRHKHIPQMTRKTSRHTCSPEDAILLILGHR